MRRIHLAIAEDYNEVRMLTEDELIALERLVVKEIHKCSARDDDWGVKHYMELHAYIFAMKSVRRCERVNGLM